MKYHHIILFLSWSLFMIFGAGAAQSHHTYDGFRNPYPGFKERDFSDFLRWSVWDRLTGKKPKHPATYSFPLADNDGSYLRANHTDFTVTWVGHSTLLIQIEGVTILTDPIWSKRSSPVKFAGPKRQVPPGLALKDLPPVDLVIISHDHYDHLDKETLKKLGNKPFYLVPLGIGSILEDLDIKRYAELDWWDTITFNKLEIICTPAQHFSGRNPLHQNKTLWASWAIRGREHSFYYGGDSGYFTGFSEIGKKFGPFDVAALPIGAYQPRWFMGPVHMDPDEAVRAYLDLKARYFVPIHWGTFQLADEPLDEPPQKLRQSIKARNLPQNNFLILKHGQTKVLPAPKNTAGGDQPK